MIEINGKEIRNLQEQVEYLTESNKILSTEIQEIRNIKVESYTKTEADAKFQTIEAAQTELSGKQDELVSGTNIKTVDMQSILGSGNISTRRYQHNIICGNTSLIQNSTAAATFSFINDTSTAYTTRSEIGHALALAGFNSFENNEICPATGKLYSENKNKIIFGVYGKTLSQASSNNAIEFVYIPLGTNEKVNDSNFSDQLTTFKDTVIPV